MELSYLNVGVEMSIWFEGKTMILETKGKLLDATHHVSISHNAIVNKKGWRPATIMWFGDANVSKGWFGK